jgi:hypothetical protein
MGVAINPRTVFEKSSIERLRIVSSTIATIMPPMKNPK